jgi:hypothetical protein
VPLSANIARQKKIAHPPVELQSPCCRAKRQSPLSPPSTHSAKSFI